ncbi:hypothetical protein B0T19DRAFT_12199 [Cercophora scortea]|uniref:Uncharacterized protein n=1 Tax=Cercophora scortea TaxID=314031 RepID=A0AAE0J273_9PEZI|nr:hypothetical protein B0T19DRAFT_12199 [Cercophora scortea]
MAPNGGYELEQHLVCVLSDGHFVIAQRGNTPDFELMPESQAAKILQFMTDPYYKNLAIAINQYWAVQEEEGVNFSLSTGTVAAQSAPGMLIVLNLAQNITRVAAGVEPFPLTPNFQLEFANDLECVWTYLLDLDYDVFHLFFCHEKKIPGHLFEHVGDRDAWVPRHIMSMDMDEMVKLREENGWTLWQGDVLPALFKEIRKACAEARRRGLSPARKCPDERTLRGPGNGPPQSNGGGGGGGGGGGFDMTRYPPRPTLRSHSQYHAHHSNDEGNGHGTE